MNETKQEAPLTPGRAALAREIASLADASRRLDEAGQPLAVLEKIKAGAVAGEAAQLRAEIARLRQSHESALTGWIHAGAVGNRPVEPPELLPTELRLAEIARAAADAEPRLRAAHEAQGAAAQRVRDATGRRDEAVAPAAVEAAEAMLDDLRQRLRQFIEGEARMQSVVHALRLLGNQGGSSGAFAAAERIQARLTELKRAAVVRVDPEAGRRLLEALKINPGAELAPVPITNQPPRAA